MAYYAWSDLKVGESAEDPNAPQVKTVAAGESVSQADLGVSDEEFQQLLEAGAVREEEYPQDALDRNVPPSLVAVEQANQAMEEAQQAAAATPEPAPAPEPEAEAKKASGSSKP